MKTKLSNEFAPFLQFIFLFFGLILNLFTWFSLYLDFNKMTLLLSILMLIGTTLFVISAFKLKSVYVKENFLVVQNLFGKKKLPFNEPLEIEETWVPFLYSISIDNGTKYYFQPEIGTVLKSFSSLEGNYIVDRMTEKLKSKTSR